MKLVLAFIILVDTMLVNAVPLKKLPTVKNYDFLKRKTRSTDGQIGCMHMATEPGEYTFRGEGSQNVCGLYLISPPETIIELEFTNFNIDCTAGLLAIVDGWEMNNEFFPSPEDHDLTLMERYKTYCNLNKPSKAFVASQNVALIQHLIPQAGEGFSVRVKFVKTPQPCNVVSTTQSGIHTLKNYGSRRNCSISIIYPESITLASVDVGVTSRKATIEADFGLTSKCMSPHGADFVEIMGGDSLELNESGERKNVVCGIESNPGSLATVIGCQHSVVRLVSSGNFFNTVTFVYSPPTEEEFAAATSGLC